MNKPKTVFKYSLSDVVSLPAGAEVLTVQSQNNEPYLWALVDDPHRNKPPMEDREFLVYGTGHTIDQPLGPYVGTFQLEGGLLVFHVFEKGESK